MNKDQHGKHTVGYQPCSMTDLNRAVAVLNNGGVVAFPTETYYGLAVDPLNPLALNLLFVLKQRDIAKPILTLVDNRESFLAGTAYPYFSSKNRSSHFVNCRHLYNRSAAVVPSICPAAPACFWKTYNRYQCKYIRA